MAASPIPRPGSQYGPCVEPCGHADCRASRLQAESRCSYCGEPCGYDVDLYRADSGGPYAMDHARCVELASRESERLGDLFGACALLTILIAFAIWGPA